MKINQFYNFSLLFLFLIRYSSSDTNDCHRYDLECMLGVPPEEATKNFTFCIEGQFVVINGTSPTTDKYKFVKCSTLAPKCAIKTKKVSTVFEKTVEKGEMKIVTIGCFPASELQRGEMENRNLESTRSYDSFYRIMNDLNNDDFYNTYFLHNKPNNTLDRYSHETIWVENPSEDLFDRNNEDKNGSDAWTQYFSKGKITPIMLLYTLFICISVIIRLIWLVSIAWKSMKQGYEPVTTEKSKEGIEESFEELD